MKKYVFLISTFFLCNLFVQKAILNFEYHRDNFSYESNRQIQSDDSLIYVEMEFISHLQSISKRNNQYWIKNLFKWNFKDILIKIFSINNFFNQKISLFQFQFFNIPPPLKRI